MKEGLKIKNDFIHEGRRCVVVEINRGAGIPKDIVANLPTFIDLWKPYCCGYIELKPEEVKESYNHHNLESEELTYKNTLKRLEEQCKDFKAGDSVFIGFDTAHVWNDENPESKNPDSIIEVCKEIIEELNKK